MVNHVVSTWLTKEVIFNDGHPGEFHVNVYVPSKLFIHLFIHRGHLLYIHV